MLRSAVRMQGFRVCAGADELGTIDELELDERWVVRHLVVETADWRRSERVRIPPHAVRSIHWRAGTLLLDDRYELYVTDSRLRGSSEIVGYHIQAGDEPVGHVEDLLLDDQSWRIRYLVVDTRGWWDGRHVLVPPEWIRDVSWAERTVLVDVARQTLEASPGYDPAHMPSRVDEAQLLAHYARPGYSA